MYKGDRDYVWSGILLSTVGHITVFVFMITGVLSGGVLPPAQIYTVSFESGSSLGGLSQVPEDSKNSQEAPLVKTSGEEEATTKEEEKQPEVKEEVKPEVKPEEQPVEKVEDDPDAFKIKEDPKPTRKAPSEEKVEPSPKATPKASEKPSEKPTPAPSKAPDKNAKKANEDKKGKPPTQQEINEAYQKAMQRYLGESANAGGVGFGSTGQGGKGMGGGIVKSPEWIAYKNQLESYVKKGWNWHDKKAKIEAAVAFEISPDGRISAIKLHTSSGDSAFDATAMRAVTRANPVPPAPASVYPDFKSVIINFRPY